jgi:hypothetical protein
MNVSAPAAPILTTVPRVELGAVGRWDISNWKGWEPTPDDMASAVAALACPAVRRPVIKIGHSGAQGVGEPAIGWIDNMAVTEDGQVLVGDYAGIPAWLAAEDVNGHSVLSSAYPDRSGEWEHDYVCQLGHTHPFVLHAMALLGVELPGIGTLQSLHDLYSNPPSKLEPLMPATSRPADAAATSDDVRKAYYAGPGTNWDLYIREMFLDPPELIVQNDADESLTRVAYTIAKDGTVSFGEPQPVKVQYVAARAAASPPKVVFASKAESRPGQPSQPPAAAGAGPAAPDPEGSSAVGFSDEQLTTLRQKLGTSADADEATILAALDQALTERADPPPIQPTPLDTPQIQQQPAAAGRTLPGTVVLDQETLRELQEQGRAGQAAATRLANDDRDRAISEAKAAGKIPAARLEHWTTLWDKDPEGTRSALASIPPNVVPTVPAGYVGGESDFDDEDPQFAGLFPPKVKG